MTDEIGRKRGGRESRAHSSARIEGVNVDRIPRRAKGKGVTGEGEAEHEPEKMCGPRAQNGFDADPGYIAWFYRVSRPKLWPPIEGNPARPANLEVLIEEDNANEKCDVFEICRTVRAD
ncbi:putative IMP dehydrogenase/GMP reductase, partial [Trifolium medium]|nr:putative IMP dehydrogenase/GMP reductase [Trifolium medium]